MLESFTNNICKSQIKQIYNWESNWEKSWSNRGAMIIVYIVPLIKKILLHKTSYFPESYIHSKRKIEVNLNLSNNTAKSDLKGQHVLTHENLLKGMI